MHVILTFNRSGILMAVGMMVGTAEEQRQAMRLNTVMADACEAASAGLDRNTDGDDYEKIILTFEPDDRLVEIRPHLLPGVRISPEGSAKIKESIEQIARAFILHAIQVRKMEEAALGWREHAQGGLTEDAQKI